MFSGGEVVRRFAAVLEVSVFVQSGEIPRRCVGYLFGFFLVQLFDIVLDRLVVRRREVSTDTLTMRERSSRLAPARR